MRNLILPCLAVTVLVGLGCAGIDPATVSQVNLNLSNPSSDFNGNLSQIITATNLTRSFSGAGVTLTVEQTPGPTGITSRIVRAVVSNGTPGLEYALLAGGTTFVEVQEGTALGSRVWRSYGGSLKVQANDAGNTELILTNVHMQADGTTAAAGLYDLDGSIRFTVQ